MKFENKLIVTWAHKWNSKPFQVYWAMRLNEHLQKIETNKPHTETWIYSHIGGQPPCKPSKQPTWFVPVRCVWVIGTFRGGVPEPSANQIWSWTNRDQTRFCPYQTKCKPIFKFSEPWTNLFWGLQFHCRTLSKPSVADWLDWQTYCKHMPNKVQTLMDLYFSPGQGRQASRICEPVATQGAATQASK